MANDDRNATEDGRRPSMIAKELGRSSSAILRELKRNGGMHHKANRRRGRMIAGRSPERIFRVPAKLLAIPPGCPKALYSPYAKPAKYGGRLTAAKWLVMAALYPAGFLLPVACETIYTAIHAMPRGEPCTEHRQVALFSIGV